MSSNRFNIVLFEPLIPQNTGTIARLTAATECYLHLIEPLGFEISDKYLKRAGLDYWPWVKLSIHKNWNAFLGATNAQRIFLFSARVVKPYWEVKFEGGDYLVFGNEEKGFSPELHEQYADQRFTIPMKNSNVRSLNLACSVAAVLFEATRQTES